MICNPGPLPFAICVVLALSCGGSPAAPAQALQVTSVASFNTDGGAFPMETTLAIRDQATWQHLWAQLNSTRIPAPALPSIDFTTEMLVVAAMGPKPTGGYQIAINGATEQGGTVTVSVTATSPGSCMVAQVLTSPVAVSKLPLRSGEVTFSIVRQVKNCD